MKAKNSDIIYFLTRSLFLGFGFTLLFDQSSKDAYLGAIIGMGLGLIFIFLYSYIIELKGNKSLKEVFKSDKIVGTITRIFFILVSILIFVYILVIYKIFVVSFLLVSSPEIFVTIPIVILFCYAAFKGIKGISRLAGALLPISISISIIILLCLVGLCEKTNFLPILTAPPMGIIKTALIFMGLVTFPNILSLHFRGETKGIIKMYLVASILLILAAFSINGVLGDILINTFRFPEYMVLKQIKLFQFIEKMENVLSVIWILDLFIAGTMAIYSVKELLPDPKNKITTIILLILILYIIDNYIAFNYVNELKLFYLLPFVSTIIPIVIILLMFYLLKKKK